MLLLRANRMRAEKAIFNPRRWVFHSGPDISPDQREFADRVMDMFDVSSEGPVQPAWVSQGDLSDSGSIYDE